MHTKWVLLAIVLLNIVDCILVMGELILDIYYLKGQVKSSPFTFPQYLINHHVFSKIKINNDYFCPMSSKEGNKILAWLQSHFIHVYYPSEYTNMSKIVCKGDQIIFLF